MYIVGCYSLCWFMTGMSLTGQQNAGMTRVAREMVRRSIIFTAISSFGVVLWYNCISFLQVFYSAC